MANGLLDFINSPAGMGLLSAVGSGLAGARRGAPLNAVGMGLLGGVQGYANAQENQQQIAFNTARQKLLDSQVAENVQQVDARKREADLKQRQMNYLSGMNQVTSPRVGAAPNKPDPMRMLALQMDPKTIDTVMNAGNLGKPTIKEFREVRNPDGSVSVAGFDEYGNVTNTNQTPFKAPEVRDFGGYVGGIDQITGKVSRYGDKTMSAADRDQSARGWAGIAAQRDANNIQRQAQRTQIVEGADGGVYLVDKGTGLSRPAATMNGQGITAGKAGEAKLQKVRDAKDAIELIDMASELIPKATGSGIGAASDATMRFFGGTSEGAQNAARLEALGGALVMKMPRMEGPQSNMDQILYREMAGKIGDRTVPAAEKAAALETIRTLNAEYAGLPQAQGGQNGGKQVARRGTVNGRRVVMYTDGTTAYED